MAQGEPSKIPFTDWDGFDIQEYEYSDCDRKGVKGPCVRTKKAKVVMLNPDVELLGRWTVATCLIIKHSTSDLCMSTLLGRIIDQSGAQFPIAGIVLEDEYKLNEKRALVSGHDGVLEAFGFRNGVTVRLEGVRHRTLEPPTSDEIARAVASNTKMLGKGGEYGRIMSTTRADYVRYENAQHSAPKDVTGLKWLEVVRDLYQDAWRRAHNPQLAEGVEKYRNDLLVAGAIGMCTDKDLKIVFKKFCAQ